MAFNSNQVTGILKALKLKSAGDNGIVISMVITIHYRELFFL